jgi:hypothetical protein
METWNNQRLLWQFFIIVCCYTTRTRWCIYEKNLQGRTKKEVEITIIGMPRATIVEVINLAKEIEEEMLAPHRSKEF